YIQAEDGIRDFHVTGVQTCALPILESSTALTIPSISLLKWSIKATSGVRISSIGKWWTANTILIPGLAFFLNFWSGAKDPSEFSSEERRVGRVRRGRPAGADQLALQ